MTQNYDYYDYVIIGGGFYGCCLALYLRSISKRLLIVEAGDKLLDRASHVNQARIHTGFHYPRSALTAVKSMLLHKRFAKDFQDAVVDDFQMLYAISRRRSKVSARRFYRMFQDIGAPISSPTSNQLKLFDNNMIEEVFACRELAFDYTILRQLISERLSNANIDPLMNTSVVKLTDLNDGVILDLSCGKRIKARIAFNVTYAQINNLLSHAGLPKAHLKYEKAEIALVEPPEEIEKVGITIMDGPFFSIMPFPAEKLYSLTHVRYTPHKSWTDSDKYSSPYTLLKNWPLETRVRHMILDSQRYVPCLANTKYKKSIFEIKTVLLKNEQDDGRPILYHRTPVDSNIISILGGKIDNIYDLFSLVQQTQQEFSSANDRYIFN